MQRFFKIGVLKISQFLQDNTVLESPTQVFSYEVCEIFENTSFYRTPPVAAFGDNKSHTRLFTLSKQTFSSQRVTFLKQPIIYGFIDDKNKETLMKKFFRLSLCELKRLKRILRIFVA